MKDGSFKKITSIKKKVLVQEAQNADDKRLLQQAGDVISSIGDHIVQAKESVVDFIAYEIVVVKKNASKIARKIKKTVKKIPVNKTVKKAEGKPIAKKKQQKKSLKKLQRKPSNSMQIITIIF